MNRQNGAPDMVNPYLRPALPDDDEPDRVTPLTQRAVDDHEDSIKVFLAVADPGWVNEKGRDWHPDNPRHHDPNKRDRYFSADEA